ncbi:MAG: hypothetical protein E7281_09100 [Lachnospiraceae bacterium]|nr:hypothetical protein [Lachnospiraceae bacterium]
MAGKYMNLTLDISVYDLGMLAITFVGSMFALFQWKKGNDLRRAEFLRTAIEKMRDDRDIVYALYKIVYEEEWYNPDLIFNHNEESKFDKATIYFDYLCYLRRKKILTKDDFKIFEYEIHRMGHSKDYVDYIYNLYHFAKKNGTEPTFTNLLQYMKNHRCLPENFWDEDADGYNVLLNIRNEEI